MTATYTNPKTMAAEATTYGDFNTYIRDNTEYLKQQADTFDFILDVFVSSDSATTGDAAKGFWIPALIGGYNLVDCDACVYTPSSSDTVTSDATTIQLRNPYEGADLLTTPITIDAAEFSSYSAAVPPVIDTTHDDVQTGEIIWVDVDQVGSGTLGLTVHLTFRAPST